MARRRWHLPAVPKPLLPLPLLSSSHCHSPSLILKRFQNQTNFDFRHGLLADRGKTLLGYLSLGEVEQYRPYFSDVESEGILLGENEDWEGSFFVDVRDPRWTSRVIEQLVPEILRRGFAGVFLDTLDNAGHLERLNPARNRGMTIAAARLVRTIRFHYPTIRIMMNRGYEILPEVESHIDMVLGESVFADYDFQSKTYRLVPRDLYRRQVNLLQETITFLLLV